MFNSKFATVLALALLSTACAPSFQQQRAQRLDELQREAELQGTKGDENAIGTSVEILVRERPSAVLELFQRSPKSRSTYLAYLDRTVRLEDVTSPAYVQRIQSELIRARDRNVLTPAEFARLDDRLDAAVGERNRTGAIAFDLTDPIEYRVMQTAVQRDLLLRHTLDSVKRGEHRLAAMHAIANAAAEGKLTAAQHDLAEITLTAAGLQRAELPILQATFPQLVAKSKATLFVRGNLSVKGLDRLAEDDLRKSLQQKFKGLDLAVGDDTAPVRISAERVRQNERITPETRDTITYAQYQVNMAYAVLLMPRNASYLYDVSRSGASIEYGYVVTVEDGRTPRFEKIVRGTLSAEQVRCSNARIQNVFGGVTSADFVANDDMASRCRKGDSRSLNDLRDAVFEQVTNAMAEAPQLKTLVGD
jgi:hypothetical protein